LPVLSEAGAGVLLKNLFLFPTCGAAFYKYIDKAWREVYAENLSLSEKNKIKNSFELAFSKLNYTHPQKVYGDVLEDRDTQITFSAFGQNAPLELKEAWDPDSVKRLQIINVLAPMLSEFDLAVGGTTSIDVLHKGINKAYGIKKMEEHLGITKEVMLFLGDKVFPGGNDYAAKEAGVECIQVANPEETKKQIARILGL
jgi:HAD superfamily hydrolase (TIGR01484 family)